MTVVMGRWGVSETIKIIENISEDTDEEGNELYEAYPMSLYYTRL